MTHSQLKCTLVGSRYGEDANRATALGRCRRVRLYGGVRRYRRNGNNLGTDLH